MARVVVDVMPKPEILDPQGKAVTGALARLGFAGVAVRQGKRFELDLEGELTEERLADVHRVAEILLANTVIETFNVRVEEAEAVPSESPVEAPNRAANADVASEATPVAPEPAVDAGPLEKAQEGSADAPAEGLEETSADARGEATQQAAVDARAEATEEAAPNPQVQAPEAIAGNHR